jgi:hypothetical protein
MKYSTTRRLGVLALSVLASLVLALPAWAAVRPDDRAGLHGVGVSPAPAQTRPDDRPGFRGAGRQAGLTSFSSNHAVPGTESGFDWAAAGAGAGTATALVLLLTWSLTFRRNQRRSGMPA